MADLVSQKQHPASSQSLSEVASKLPCGLPDELRKLLMRTNGGSLLADAVLRVPDGSTAGAISILPAEKLDSVTRTILGSGAGHTVWARDGNGNALTVDSDGFVCFWDHDTDEEIPFKCRIGDLGRHFFRRQTEERRVGSPTAAALEELLAEAAGLDSIELLLRNALASDTVGAFLTAAARHGRVDVVSAITALTKPSTADLTRALCTAVERNQLEIAEALLGRGADIDGRDLETE